MRPEVNAIAGRLSLRPPQREALEILDRVTEIVPPSKATETNAALAAIRSEYPTVTDFERDFPSLCFALATGVGKTRLMGAFISYLHQAHGINNFFVLAPNLTIYKKLIADFTAGTPKYVFKGIAAFATDPPEVITGDNYESRGPLLSDLVRCKVNIFNIAKITSEVRGGRSPRIKRLSEYIGQSYFEYLAALPDLVLLMDESHRYRASAGIRAINELRPVLGLELTATPFVETQRGGVPFKNIILDYPLGKAMADGFVKEPAVVTQKDFNAAGMAPGDLERLKLEDGVRMHEQTRVQLETYARENGVEIVKPFVLVIARDTTHASQLLELIQGVEFFDGRYADKVIQVDSSRTGAEEEEMISKLLEVEKSDSPTEIVIHVNMLKEGWDVTNLYTIVPLRAANARILIEQSIGRGLRLPYGKRTGVPAVDRLSIIAHDRFQELIDAANSSDSPIRMQSVVLDPNDLRVHPRTVVSQSNVASALGFQPNNLSPTTEVAGSDQQQLFESPEDQKVAQVTFNAIRRLQSDWQSVPGSAYLERPEVQARLLQEVQAEYQPGQLGLEGIAHAPDLAAIVAKTAEFVIRKTIDIPRILVVPQGEVRSGFRPFELSLGSLRYPVPTNEMLSQELRTGKVELISLGRFGVDEQRLEDYVVSGLVDFDDVAYDSHADLLYDLAQQTVRHFATYLKEDEMRLVLRQNQRPIANLIHSQMQAHRWEEATGYDNVVSKGFTELKEMAYSQSDPTMDFRSAPSDKSNMAKYLFDGFKRCLYPVQKFQSDTERVLSIVLDREAEKWFKPARGQFQIYYKSGADHLEYQPDFVAETAAGICMLEPKMRSQMIDPDVLAKKDAAVAWCARATEYTSTYGGKAWSYALIPHDEIAENMTLAGLNARFGSR